jgi:hypothetical protein
LSRFSPPFSQGGFFDRIIKHGKIKEDGEEEISPRQSRLRQKNKKRKETRKKYEKREKEKMGEKREKT